MKLKELQSLMQVCHALPRSVNIVATPMSHSAIYLLKDVDMQDISVFENPKLDLEQYPTGPHLASRLLFTVRYHCCSHISLNYVKKRLQLSCPA